MTDQFTNSTARDGDESRAVEEHQKTAAAQIDAEVGMAESEAEAAAEALERDIDAVSELQRERDDLLALSQRLQADFENYKKRMLREQTAVVERATEGLIEQLLPVLDSFEAAFGQLGSDDDVDADKVRKGVELVHTQLTEVLQKAGLEVVDAAGADFDPHVHEAVSQEAGDGEPVVSDVMRSGYVLKGRVIRPAMVKVTHAGS